MHVIKDKKSGKVIFIEYSPSESLRPGKEVYKNFDEKSMEIGWTDKTYIPAHFTIDSKGKVVELSLEQAVTEGLFQLAPDQKLAKGKIVSKSTSELVSEKLLKFEDVKKKAIEYHSAMAFGKRQELIPDYKLQNAALNIYEEDIVDGYKATVKAFRDEFYRIKAEIERAKTVEDVEAVKAHYPKSIVSMRNEKKDVKKEAKKKIER